MKENLTVKFKKAQKQCINQVKKELINKQKRTHWIWFVFPQLKGLGTSVVSQYYALNDLKETRLYYSDKYLRRNMNNLIDIMLNYDNVDLLDVFGTTDYVKVRSCMTIFYLATHEKRFKMIIDKFYGGLFDNITIKKLNINEGDII